MESILTEDDRLFCVPFRFGFERRFVQGTNDEPRVVYVHGKRIFENSEQIHQRLMELKISIPMACFTLVPSVNAERRLMVDSAREQLLYHDLSDGKERFPIPVLCPVDLDCVPKLPSVSYLQDNVILELHMDSTIKLHHDKNFLECCDCVDDCKNKFKCACFLKTLDNCCLDMQKELGDKNIGYNAFRLFNSVATGIFECHNGCHCNRSICHNRVSQQGHLFPLQLAHYGSKGWGVRTSVDIPEGAFICMYFGEIINEDVIDSHNDVDSKRWIYLAAMELGCKPKNENEKDVVTTDILKSDNGSTHPLLKFDLLVDRYNKTNIGAFINHSCEPNAFAQYVFWDNHDLRLPRIAIFALTTIQAGEEITWDYSYSDANEKGLSSSQICQCGAKKCRKVLF